MLCQQCGALISDEAEVCDNCGYRIVTASDEPEEVKGGPEADKSAEKVPVIRTIEEFAPVPKKLTTAVIVKALSVLGALLCFGLFFVAADVIGSVESYSQTQSFMGGFFSGGATTPGELYISLKYGFLGFGTAFSFLLLIQGFKNNR